MFNWKSFLIQWNLWVPLLSCIRLWDVRTIWDERSVSICRKMMFLPHGSIYSLKNDCSECCTVRRRRRWSFNALPFFLRPFLTLSSKPYEVSDFSAIHSLAHREGYRLFKKVFNSFSKRNAIFLQKHCWIMRHRLCSSLHLHLAGLFFK